MGLYLGALRLYPWIWGPLQENIEVAKKGPGPYSEYNILRVQSLNPLTLRVFLGMASEKGHLGVRYKGARGRQIQEPLWALSVCRGSTGACHPKP